MLEYDSNKGFRCQRCSEWTLGGRLYSSEKGERVCFMCHMEDVSKDMMERFGSADGLELGFEKENLGSIEIEYGEDQVQRERGSPPKIPSRYMDLL